MRGLTSAVQAEILFGLQERCRRGVITYLYQLRIFTRHLRAAGVVTIADFDVARLPRPCPSARSGAAGRDIER